MNYSECLTYLTDLGHELRGVKFDLDSIRVLMSVLGDAQRSYPTAIVAGTNGKGSTAAMLASILVRSGYRTGLYTSPHLVRVNERVRINGFEISNDDFARAFTTVRDAVDRLLAEHALPHHPSFFEFLTATAFVHFARAKVDFAVLEVGMGGRLDATNITEPRVSVITNVDLDHMEFLGSTHAAIAREKAGVIHPGRPVVSGCEHPDAVEVVRQRSAELGAKLFEVPNLARVSNLRQQAGRYTFDLVLEDQRFSGLASPLAGRFQVKNAAAAVAAAWRLAAEGWDVSADAIRNGLDGTRWPGRLEVASLRPLVLLDGAHNPAAAREVAAFVREELDGRRLRLVYASMRDKSIGEISDLLFPLAEEVYLTHTPQARAASPDEVIAALRTRPPRLTVEPDPARALELARGASGPDDVVLATGSLFLVGALQQAAAPKGKSVIGG